MSGIGNLRAWLRAGASGSRVECDLMPPDPTFGAEIELPLELSHGFEGILGLSVTELSEERASGRVTVRDELLQPTALVHGGVYAAIAESLASWGTAYRVIPEGSVAVGMSNQTNFLRPIREGTIHATAIAKHRGRTTWVWEVEISDDQGRLCVLSRVTI
ncbi:MAG TPA: PaaI family thioesterase, partial [Solirubrobacteraceae bacterium]